MMRLVSELGGILIGGRATVLGPIGLRRHGRSAFGGPLPDVADHVVEVVAVRRERANWRGACIAVEPEVLPREPSLPGVGHPPPAGSLLLAPRESRPLQATACGKLPLGLGRQCLADPSGVRRGILVGDLGHGVLRLRGDVALRAFRPVPARSRHVAPPHHRVQRHRALGCIEHRRTGDEHRSIRARIIRRVKRSLGDRDIAGRRHEVLELSHGHRVRIDPELLDGHRAHRQLLGIELFRAHRERATRDPDHAPGRGPCSVDHIWCLHNPILAPARPPDNRASPSDGAQ